MDEESPLLILKWNHFHQNFTTQFASLKSEEEFVDVTFSCHGKFLRAHRVVLSASSPYLTTLFKETPCKHPVIILDDVPSSHLEWLLAFIYTGAVSVPESELPALLESAALLQIRGLSENAVTDSEKPLETPSSVPSRRRSRASSELQELAPPAKRPAKVDARRTSKPKMEHEDVLLKEEVEPEDEPVSEMDCEPLAQLQRIGSEYIPEGKELPPPTLPLSASTPPNLDWDNLPAAQSIDDSASADGRRRHSLDPRPCPICKRHYSNLSNLRQHLRLIHNPQLVKCQLCDKTFKTDLYLRRHLAGYHYAGLSDSGTLTTVQ